MRHDREPTGLQVEERAGPEEKKQLRERSKQLRAAARRRFAAGQSRRPAPGRAASAAGGSAATRRDTRSLSRLRASARRCGDRCAHRCSPRRMVNRSVRTGCAHRAPPGPGCAPHHTAVVRSGCASRARRGATAISCSGVSATSSWSSVRICAAKPMTAGDALRRARPGLLPGAQGVQECGAERLQGEGVLARVAVLGACGSGR